MKPPIPLHVIATEDNFDDAAYLRANADVQDAVVRGAFGSGLEHFRHFGRAEGRAMRMPILTARDEKLARLAPFFRKDMARQLRGDKPDFLTPELRAETRIGDTENVSSHSYDPVVRQALQDFDGELALDCGAGKRDVYYHDVVNYEIVDYDSTDVIGVGEALPFVDNTFSVVISIAVLEHVRNPFQCAAELIRVLRPGGRLICAYPFLQPVHGYPHHYFNATPQGARRLFEDRLLIEDQTIPKSLHPVFALHWIVQSWARGLAEDGTREDFLDMSLRDLLQPPWNLVDDAFCAELSPAAQEELACGSLVIATKPKESPRKAKALASLLEIPGRAQRAAQRLIPSLRPHRSMAHRP